MSTQPWTRWCVAVTGMNARPDNPGPGCAVVRCLREASGFVGSVVGLGYDSLDAGFYTGDACGEGYLLPYPSAGAEALLERLQEVLAATRLDAIVPCLDAELPNFIALSARLRRLGVRLLLPSRSSLRQRDKDRLPELCAQAGVLTPRVRTVTQESFFEPGSLQREGLDFPLVVKGVFYDAYVVSSPEEARHRFRRIAASWGYPVLAQEFVEGEEVNLMALGLDGRMVAPVMMRKQALTEKGKAWAGVAIDDPDLLDTGQRLIGTLRWSGPLELELLRSRAGDLYLIEINPRFPAWVYLSHGAGRNLPAALLALMQGIPVERLELAPSRPGTTFIRYAQETIVTMNEILDLSSHGRTRGAAACARWIA